MIEIFVFGSNLRGIHGKGAALEAKKKWGAISGFGHGHQGNSYAIPTKRTPYETLPLEDIRYHVAVFVAFATTHPNMTFRLTPIGCGHAGYRPEQIAPMFRSAPPNVILPDVFASISRPV